MVLTMEYNKITNLSYALSQLFEDHALVNSVVSPLPKHVFDSLNPNIQYSITKLKACLSEISGELETLKASQYEISEYLKQPHVSYAVYNPTDLRYSQYTDYINEKLLSTRSHTKNLYQKLAEHTSDVYMQLRADGMLASSPFCRDFYDLTLRVQKDCDDTSLSLDTTWADAPGHGVSSLTSGTGGAFGTVSYAPVSPAKKFMDSEAFWGLKVISIVGALLLILGVFTFGRFLFINVTATAQLVLIYVLGLVLMVLGEVLHRKQWRDWLAYTLTGAGAGVLFLSTAFGYMTLDVLNLWVSLGISLAVSVIVFAAAVRYKSQLIAIFSILGGMLLPMFIINTDIAAYASVYFALIIIFTAILTTRLNWQATRVFGMISGAIALGVLNIMFDPYYWVELTVHLKYVQIAFLGISIIVAFIATTSIPIVGAWIAKTKILSVDIVMLAICMFLYFTLALAWTSNFIWNLTFTLSQNTLEWLVILFFVLFCSGMAIAIEKRRQSDIRRGESEKDLAPLRMLFFIADVSFTVLFVLTILDGDWFILGLLALTALQLIYGFLRGAKRFIVSGGSIGALCLLIYLVYLFPFNSSEPSFIMQYFALTFTSAGIFVASLVYKPLSKEAGALIDIFRAIAILNMYLFIFYVINGVSLPAFTSIFVTLVFWLSALTWIFYGFAIKNNVYRVSGLVLALFSVFKLFVFDLHGIEPHLRIISYFVGGAVLLAISFTYQYFIKKEKNSINKFDDNYINKQIGEDLQ